MHNFSVFFFLPPPRYLKLFNLAESRLRLSHCSARRGAWSGIVRGMRFRAAVRSIIIRDSHTTVQIGIIMDSASADASRAAENQTNSFHWHGQRPGVVMGTAITLASCRIVLPTNKMEISCPRTNMSFYLTAQPETWSSLAGIECPTLYSVYLTDCMRNSQ